MKNIGSFFRLARAQLARATDDNPPNDLVLGSLLPADHFPTGLSPERKIVNRFVPPPQHMEAMAAIAYFGYEQPIEIVMLFQDHINRDQALEQRACLVDNGQITATADSPSRTWPWARVKSRLGYDRRQAALVHGRFVDILKDYTNRFIGDVRDWLSDDWVEYTQDARLGISWVFDDAPGPAGDEVCSHVVQHAISEQVKHWHPQSEPWTVDSVVRWAEVCGRYVKAKREI